METSVKQIVQAHKIKDTQVSVVNGEEGIVIHLAGDVFFASGSAQLNPGVEQTLLAIVTQLKKDKDHTFSVEGHTDAQPIHTALFRSNWDLYRSRSHHPSVPYGSGNEPQAPVGNWLR